MITVEIPEKNAIIEFPDGTPEDIINMAIQRDIFGIAPPAEPEAVIPTTIERREDLGIDLAPADYPGGLPSDISAQQTIPQIQPEAEPIYEGLPVGEPRVLDKAIQIPFLPGRAIARAPGAFTEAEPFEIERREASISDLGGKLVRNLLGKGAATEALPYDIAKREDFGDMGEALGRLFAEMGVEIATAHILIYSLAGTIGAGAKAIMGMKVPDRRLVVQSLDDMVRGMEAQGASEGKILKAMRGLGEDEVAFARFAEKQGIKIEPEIEIPKPLKEQAPGLTPKQKAELRKRPEGEVPFILKEQAPGKPIPGKEVKTLGGLTQEEYILKVAGEEPLGVSVPEATRRAWNKKKWKAVAEFENRAVVAEAKEVTPKKPVAKPKAKEAKVRTLRGRIKEMGGINFLRYTGELRNMPTAVKYLSKKTGIPIDNAVNQLISDGWLDKDTTVTSFLEDLRTKPDILKRDRVIRDVAEKAEHELLPQERRLREEAAWEPEAPPEGDYIQMRAEDLPEGTELTIIEGKSKEGWDKYRITSKDSFSITLIDGETIELKPGDLIEVLKKELPKAPPVEQPELIKARPALFEAPKKVRPKLAKPEKLAAVDLVSREASVQFQQDGIWAPKQKPLLAEAEAQLGDTVSQTIDEVLEAGVIGVDIVKKPPKAPKFKFTDSAIESRYKSAKITKISFWNQTKEMFAGLARKAARAYEHLPRTGEFARLEFDLLKLAKQKGIASDRTLRALQGVTIKLNATNHDLFSRKVMLDDFVEMVKEDPDVSLPFGYRKETVETDLERLDAHIIDNQLVLNAIESRNKLWNAIRPELIKAMKAVGYDMSGILTRKAYFRHQVLEYVNAKGLFGTGKRLRTPTGRGYAKERRGSELDINTDYLQAEHEVMAQMLYDIEIANTIANVDKNYNIIDALEKEAKAIDEDWKDVIPEGYTDWQPREGTIFYMADSIPAKLAELLTSGKLEEIGLRAEDLKTVLAVGGKRRRFVIKNEIADTLDSLIRERTQNVISVAHRELIRKWKMWQLVSPRRFFKYNIRNLTGDADAAFAGSPAVFLEVPQALIDLYGVYVENKAMPPLLKEWFERGGTQSTLQVQEMEDINRLKMFMHLQEKKGKITKAPVWAWQKYWKAVRLSTDYREAVLRYAAYRRFVKEMKASPDGLPKSYVASRSAEIKALETIEDRAYWMSNDLLGAYDRVGIAGQELSDRAWPFYRWKEVNFRRYGRMFANAANEGTLGSTAGRKLLGSVAIKTPYRAYRIGRWAIRAAAFLAMVEIWNKTRFPDAEKELPKSVRDKPHIIIGRDKDGNIEYFSRVGALSDLLENFGLDQLPEYTREVLDGNMTIKEAAKEMGKQPVNVIIQGGVPFIKLAGELLTRRALFPDVFKPGTVRDRMFHVARSFGLENEYVAIADKPSRGYKKTIGKFFYYKVDPYEAAYHDIYGERMRFMKKVGKYGEGFWISPKSNALYNSKLALRYDDYESSVSYMADYFRMGGTMDGLSASYENLNPLSGLSQDEQTAFVMQLSEENKTRLVKALKFYADIITIK